MSMVKRLWNWCRIPPEPKSNKNKKLLASTLICTILSVSFASLISFYGCLVIEQSGTFAISSTILSVANSAEGPNYIQNITYQSIAKADISSEDPIRIGNVSVYRFGELGNINARITNFGQNMNITAIEIYRDKQLFALINGPFVLKTQSIGLLDFWVYNLTELSRNEKHWINQIGIRETNNDSSQNIESIWKPVSYTIVLRSSDEIAAIYDHFYFPTAPVQAIA